MWGLPYWRRSGKYETTREFLELILSWIVISIAFGAHYIFTNNALGLLLSFIAVATAFIFHEVAHREVARRFGLYARYRAWYLGLLLALIIALITARAFGTPFVLAAPGAVYVYAYMGIPPPDIEFKVAVAGPLTNIIIGFILLMASHLTSPPYTLYLKFIGSVNAWIAIFNLLPFPPLDGYKVFKYSITTWILIMLFAIVIYAIL